MVGQSLEVRRMSTDTIVARKGMSKRSVGNSRRRKGMILIHQKLKDV